MLEVLGFLAGIVRVAGNVGVVATIIALPFAFLRKTRVFVGTALVYASFAVGASYWMDCLRITYDTFGLFGAILGVGAAGFGVVIATLGHFIVEGQWASFAAFLGGGLLILAVQFGGWLLISNEEERRGRDARKASEPKRLTPTGKTALLSHLRRIGQLK